MPEGPSTYDLQIWLQPSGNHVYLSSHEAGGQRGEGDEEDEGGGRREHPRGGHGGENGGDKSTVELGDSDNSVEIDS